MTTGPRQIRLVVDRREGKFLVLIGDDDRTMDVPATQLPKDCRAEGVVLDVPLDDRGEPIWKAAARNSAEEVARLREVEERLERLRRTDPGGDVEL